MHMCLCTENYTSAWTRDLKLNEIVVVITYCQLEATKARCTSNTNTQAKHNLGGGDVDDQF